MAKIKKSKAELKLEQSIKTASSLINKQTGNSAPRAKRQTETELQFNKQVKRIKNAIRRLERTEGYVFDTSIYNLVKRPERLTKAHIEKLKSIKPGTLRNMTSVRVAKEAIETKIKWKEGVSVVSDIVTNTDTGESFEDIYIKTEDHIDEAEFTLLSFEILISQAYEANPIGKHILEQWWDRVRDKIDDATVLASILSTLANKGWLITYRMMYNERFALAYIAEFEHNLPEELRMTEQEIRMLNGSLEQSTRAYETIEGDEDLIERLKMSNHYSKEMKLSHKY
jgi:hypothetical protein